MTLSELFRDKSSLTFSRCPEMSHWDTYACTFPRSYWCDNSHNFYLRCRRCKSTGRTDTSPMSCWQSIHFHNSRPARNGLSSDTAAGRDDFYRKSDRREPCQVCMSRTAQSTSDKVHWASLDIVLGWKVSCLELRLKLRERNKNYS